MSVRSDTVKRELREGSRACVMAVFPAVEYDRFTVPTCPITLFHTLRSCIHMYCLAFQQLERVVHATLPIADTFEGPPLYHQRAIVACMVHMVHAWCMICKCLSSKQWANHAVERDDPHLGPPVTEECLEWFRGLTPYTDEAFVKRVLGDTMNERFYPRMGTDPSALPLPEGCSPRSENPLCPYYLSINLLAWVLAEIYGLPWRGVSGNHIDGDVAVGASTFLPLRVIGVAEGNNILTDRLAAIPSDDCVAPSGETGSTLTYLSMAATFFNTDQMHLIMQSATSCFRADLGADPVRTDPLYLRGFLGSSVFYMHSSQFPRRSYDNTKGGGGKFHAWKSLTRAAIRAALGFPSIRGARRKRRYGHIERELTELGVGEQGPDHPPTPHGTCRRGGAGGRVQRAYTPWGGVDGDGGYGWRKMVAIHSLGHVVLGWAGRVLRLGRNAYTIPKPVPVSQQEKNRDAVVMV
jgi:hypothetical protein